MSVVGGKGPADGKAGLRMSEVGRLVPVEASGHGST
jgi:hypothetical protein